MSFGRGGTTRTAPEGDVCHVLLRQPSRVLSCARNSLHSFPLPVGPPSLFGPLFGPVPSVKSLCPCGKREVCGVVKVTRVRTCVCCVRGREEDP